ncbi:MAG: DNA polymerase III, subunit gamma and tau [Betaproteobacteria bacterium RIFCSPLOWO2_12_FULL_62_13b]|nr:MAG: DNA polymerase III, subunit gamma and tau [Betaproteobacteria bacterium RIFCSPLOWO2_12_FULL_62_13b]
MSYQVLARKWRPRDFESLVGQEHVVKALTHALDRQRLHHAYLFTGTRGVGKTTLARILAKALNCETGIGSKPCGKCAACTEIDSGRFVDLLEVDAATNTKVDEMRQLLENAVYAPTRGRFKVYVIDEVHMLSTSAFNAMLKTLEEPPEHIKFILATTDPQKIPVTVLSRCLQFNLKQMSSPAISTHLGGILKLEQIAAEDAALNLIAAAARGSMRDALSLLDQAIAYSAGNVTEAAVRAMLGTVDETYLFDIVEGLVQGDAQAVLRVAAAMEERTIAFDSALQDLASLLHRLALARVAPAAVAEDDPNRARILDLAGRFDPEEVQLDYQIAIHGRQDLPYAPDSYAGFTMALLRMLAFRPDSARTGTKPPAEKVRRLSGAGKSAAAPGTLDWPELAKALNVGGIAKQLAQQSALVAFKDGVLVLRLAPGFRHLAERPYQEKLRAALEDHLGTPVRLKVEMGDTAGGSAQDRAAAAIIQDEFVRGMMEQFDATIVESSIKPVQ